jgi:hypothetical protein
VVLVRNPAKGLIVSQRLQSKSAARDVEQPVQSIELDSKFELPDVLDRDWRPYLDPLGTSVLCMQGLGVVFDGVAEKGLDSPHWLSPSLRAREARPRRRVRVHQRMRRTRRPQPLPPLQS